MLNARASFTASRFFITLPGVKPTVSSETMKLDLYDQESDLLVVLCKVRKGTKNLSSIKGFEFQILKGA